MVRKLLANRMRQLWIWLTTIQNSLDLDDFAGLREFDVAHFSFFVLTANFENSIALPDRLIKSDVRKFFLGDL